MTTIRVEPDQLDAAAAKIENANNDYDRIYQAMYAEVDKMSASWQGKDNEMYTRQIKTFEDDLRQISMIMKQYSDFLRNSAKGYRETQDEVYSQASRLRTS